VHMPPKVKTTKDEILKAALGIVRKGGAQALNARALADALGCSTQPVFSNYPGMDELRADVDRAAYELYREYLATGAKRSDVPKYKAFGLAYIEFAKEEPELFRLLFMCDRSGGKKEEDTETLDRMADIISSAVGISREEAYVFHLEMWIYVHGIASMIATSYLEWDEAFISRALSDAYAGLKLHYTEKYGSEKSNEPS